MKGNVIMEAKKIVHFICFAEMSTSIYKFTLQSSGLFLRKLLISAAYSPVRSWSYVQQNEQYYNCRYAVVTLHQKHKEKTTEYRIGDNKDLHLNVAIVHLKNCSNFLLQIAMKLTLITCCLCMHVSNACIRMPSCADE